MRAFFDHNRFLILFAVLSTLMGVSMGIVKVGTSLYSLHLGASSTMQGLIAGAQTFGVLVMSIPIGFMVDQYGPGRLFVLGTVVVGAIYLVLPHYPTVVFLLLGTALTSFFMPMRFVSLNAVFMQQLDVVGEARAGWYRGTHMTGMLLIGPVIAASAVSLLGFSGTFGLISFLFALTVIVSPIVFRRYSGKGNGSGAAFRLRDIPAQLSLFSDEVDLRRACLIEFFGQGLNAFYTFFILIIAIDTLHQDAVQATRLLGAEGGAFIFALLSFGTLVARFGHRDSSSGSFAAVVLALTMLGLGCHQLLFLAGAVLLGLGLGTLQIINLTRFARIGARLGQGRISGISSLAGPAGSCFGSMVGGLLGQLYGLQAVFLFFIPVFILLAWWSRNHGTDEVFA